LHTSEDTSIMEKEELDTAAHFNTVVLIQLARIYDVMLALLTNVNPEQGRQIAAMHEAGQFLGAAPAVAISEVTDE
jgi:hypothetical protein